MRTAAAALLVVLSLALALSGQAAAQDAPQPETAPPAFVRLTYDVTIDREKTVDGEWRGKPLVAHEERRVVVTLGPRVLGVATDGKPRTLLDYAAGWEHEIDDDAGTYRSTPLVAHFGFLEIEMFNRRKLGGVLAAADLADPSFRPVELSILFGWPDPRDDADIETATDGDAIVWRLGDDELTRWTPSGHALDEPQTAALDRFLSRSCPLHWEIREAIVERAVAPERMSFRWFNTLRRERATWTLVTSERVPAPPRGVVGLQRTFDDTPLGRLARRVLGAEGGTDSATHRDELLRLSDEARKAGRSEDAALLLLESSLSDGSDVGAAMRALVGDPAHAPRVRALVSSISRGNSEPAEGLAELDAVDRSTLTHPALLDVFRANALANQGKTEESVATFLTALDTLPRVAAAYADLGNVLHRAFRTREAWLAWEIGRTIAPEHPTWQGVRGLEQHLEDTYGELL